jgi:ubiquitin carboxyl-terminal hydrolase 36/42
MGKMIVLNAPKGSGGKKGGKDARGNKNDHANGGGSSGASGAKGVAVADVLYPRGAIRMDWPAVRKVGAGLANLGNTCFMNAVMQCLTYTPPLAAFCLANEHKAFKPNTAGFSAIYEMGEHINRALASPGRTISPNAFVKNLRVLSKTFRKGRQEDAHEFARWGCVQVDCS